MRNDFESGYLEHSAKGTTWKKKAAKYLSRVWKNGHWVYAYKLTGLGYKSQEREARNNSKQSSNAAKYYKSRSNVKFTNGKTGSQRYHEESRKAESYGRKAAQAAYDYKTKSLAGVTESTIKKGKKAISKLLDSLKPQTTVRITSNLMPANTEKVYKKKK